jgi:hypothetical protein
MRNKKPVLVLCLIFAFSIFSSTLSAQKMCDYSGYFLTDGSFSCAIGSLSCSAPCAIQVR